MKSKQTINMQAVYSGKRIFLFCVFILSFSVSFSQSGKKNNLIGKENSINTITTAVPFLLIAPDSRAGGLGDAGVASSPDPNSIHWNASKFAFIEQKFGFSVSYTPWLKALVPDINLAYLSGYYKVKKDQTFGASLLYFSLGDIAFTGQFGEPLGNHRPSEFAIDFAYARKLADQWSGAMVIRYIHSNLTDGGYVDGSTTRAGNAVAADISAFYTNNKIKIQDKKSTINAGLNVSNIGNKISYSDRSGDRNRSFLPINLRLGSALETRFDEANKMGLMIDFNKLLVPTPPVYAVDPLTGQTLVNANGDYVIKEGRDPYRSIASGMFGSFSDAPGGLNEELREITYSVGLEYWYDNILALRSGYFYEHRTKGNRKFFTVGIGVKYHVFGIDFAYLVPTEQRHPLENTFRFSLLFNFEKAKKESEEATTN